MSVDCNWQMATFDALPDWARAAMVTCDYPISSTLVAKWVLHGMARPVIEKRIADWGARQAQNERKMYDNKELIG